jgi:hypothetical protein
VAGLAQRRPGDFLGGLRRDRSALVMTVMVLVFRFKMGIDVWRSGKNLGKNAQENKTYDKRDEE